jgi:hypothetical protein
VLGLTAHFGQGYGVDLAGFGRIWQNLGEFSSSTGFLRLAAGIFSFAGIFNIGARSVLGDELREPGHIINRALM